MLRSLKCAALEVLLNMGESTSAEVLLGKLEIIFGNVFTTEQLLERFFEATQKKDEQIATWACRLEELASRANEKAPGVAGAAMKRSKFWTGIRNGAVKTATRHKFDDGLSFEDLVVACRIAEAEPNPEESSKQQSSGTIAAAAAAVSEPQVQKVQSMLSQNDAKLEELLKMVKSLQLKVDTYQKTFHRPLTGDPQPTLQHFESNARQNAGYSNTAPPPTWTRREQPQPPTSDRPNAGQQYY